MIADHFNFSATPLQMNALMATLDYLCGKNSNQKQFEQAMSN